MPANYSDLSKDRTYIQSLQKYFVWVEHLSSASIVTFGPAFAEAKKTRDLDAFFREPWLPLLYAMLYVVVEGWLNPLDVKDKRPAHDKRKTPILRLSTAPYFNDWSPSADKFLFKEPKNLLLLKCFRNSVFHFQREGRQSPKFRDASHSAIFHKWTAEIYGLFKGLFYVRRQRGVIS